MDIVKAQEYLRKQRNNKTKGTNTADDDILESTRKYLNERRNAALNEKPTEQTERLGKLANYKQITSPTTHHKATMPVSSQWEAPKIAKPSQTKTSATIKPLSGNLDFSKWENKNELEQYKQRQAERNQSQKSTTANLTTTKDKSKDPWSDFWNEWNVFSVINKVADHAPDQLKYVSSRTGVGIADGIASIVDSVKSGSQGLKNVFKTQYPTLDTYKGNQDTDKTNKLKSGIENIVKNYTEGKTNHLSSGKTELDYTQRIAEMIENEYKDVDKGVISKVAADIGYNLGRMTPTIYATAMGNTFGLPAGAVTGLRMATTYSAANARATKRALQEGANPMDAMSYGVLSGTIESAGEELIGGFLGTGKGLIDTGVSKVASKLGINLLGSIKNPIVKGITAWAGNAVGEGIEEMIQEMLDVGAQKVTYNPESAFNKNEIAYAGLLGALMGGFFSLPQAVRNTRQAMSTNTYVKNVTKNLKNIDNKADVNEALNIIYAQVRTGENLVDQVNGWDIDKSQKDFIITNLDYFNTQMKNIGSALYQNQDEIIETNNANKKATADNPTVKRSNDILKTASESVRDAINTKDIIAVNEVVVTSERAIETEYNDVRNDKEVSPEIRKAVLDSVKDMVDDLEAMKTVAVDKIHANVTNEVDDMVKQNDNTAAIQYINEIIQKNAELYNDVRNNSLFSQNDKIQLMDTIESENNELQTIADSIVNQTYIPEERDEIIDIDSLQLTTDENGNIINSKPNYDRAEARAFASRLMEKYNVLGNKEFNANKLYSQIKDVYDRLAQGGNQLNADEIDASIREIANEIVDRAVYEDESTIEDRKEMRSILRDTRMYIDEADRGDALEKYGGYNEFRKKNMGRLKLVNRSNDATSVESVYDEMADRFPGYISGAAAHPSEKLVELAELWDTLKPKYISAFHGHEAEAVDEIANEIYEEYYNIPQTTAKVSEPNATEPIKVDKETSKEPEPTVQAIEEPLQAESPKDTEIPTPAETTQIQPVQAVKEVETVESETAEPMLEEAQKKIEPEKPAEAIKQVEINENMTISQKSDGKYLIKGDGYIASKKFGELKKTFERFGGKYSSDDRGFLFDENPAPKIKHNAYITDNTDYGKEQVYQMEYDGANPDYEIVYVDDSFTITKPNANTYAITLDGYLKDRAFADFRKQMSNIGGKYSSDSKSFIFKYNPTNNIATTGGATATLAYEQDKNVKTTEPVTTHTDTQTDKGVVTNEQRNESAILENESSGNGERSVSEATPQLEETTSSGREPDGDSEFGAERVPTHVGVATGTEHSTETVRNERTDTPTDIDSVLTEHVDGERDSGKNDTEETRSGDGGLVKPANYHFNNTDIDDVRPNFNVNVQAIELSKKIASEGRTATPEEQTLLAKYKGWGGLKESFIEGTASDRKLRSLLTKEEYQTARNSVQSAFYTPLELVDTMYKMLDRLGVKDGKILEPSMGVGNFFGMMPTKLMNNSELYGVEYDPLTGQIAQQLYPLANIQVSPFEDVNFTDNTFDAIIGNVPFVNASYKYKKGSYPLHDYFFMKSLDKVKNGNIIMFLTSTGTLDKLNTKTRDEIASKADLIAAFRIPNDIFKTSAGISVMTDLIILQKRPNGIAQNDEEFSNLKEYMGVPINEYFVNHPENILGQATKTKDQYGKDILNVAIGDSSLEKLLQNAVESLPKNIVNRPVDEWKGDIEAEVIAQSDKPQFLLDKNNNPIFHDPVTNTDKKITGKDAIRAKHYINISNAYENLLSVSNDNYTTEQREASRRVLNEIYDNFANDKAISDKQNRLNDTLNVRALSDDDDFWRVAGLERFDPETKSYAKSDILTKDTLVFKPPEHAATSQDAVAISINQKGLVDIKYIEKLTGFDRKRIVQDISDIAIETPDGDFELIPQYTSGYIREKLDKAKKAAKNNAKYERNVKMLEAALPKEKTATEIKPQMGAAWIGVDNVKLFIEETFGSSPAIGFDPFTGTWSVDSFYSLNQSMRKKYSTGRVDVHKVVESALNQKPIVVKDKYGDKEVTNVQETALARQKISEIKETFGDWLFKDRTRRDELVKTFNEKFNDYSTMNYRSMSQYLELPGLAENFKPRDYQKDAVARIVFGGDTLLAHGVGTGKTAEMIMSAMELKRMGLVNKVMMVVPNNKIADFRTDILKTYPSAKVLMATEKDFQKSNRARLFSKIGTNDWDIVVVGHSSFKMIPVKNETQRKFIEREIDEIETTIRSSTAESARQNRRFISQLEKSRTAAEQRLKRLLDIGRDETLAFEEMGVDALFVDEAHNFKNLPYYTKLNVSGIGSASSQRAEDMLMKTNYIRDIDGRVVFATATPITNSVSEMYNMTRFVKPEALEQAGIKSFDTWAATFGEVISKAEVSPDGRSLRVKERFSKYNNVPAMIGLFRQFADILRTEDVVKDLPKANHVEVVSPSTPYHDKYVDDIMLRIERMSAGQKQSDNMLLITNDGRAMATDLRLVASQIGGVDLDALDVPTSRINQAVTNIAKEYKASSKTKGTQFVFLDFGMSDGEDKRYNFNLYADIKRKLAKNGIPANEIADINDYNTTPKKEVLFEKMNKGEVRVLMGSTAKMGEGVNAQKKAVALHHLNAPYRPSDIEQREGRMIRYGNENKEVTVYTYIQEKSFDSYMWQMLARKGEFINQAMSGADAMSLEEVDEFVMSAQNAMAIATGNPLILRQIEVDQEIKQLSLAKKSHINAQNNLQDRLAALPSEIDKLQKDIGAMTIDGKQATDTEKQPFNMIVGNKQFEKQGEAGKAIIAQLNKKANKIDTVYDLGKYRGFDLKYSVSIDGKTIYVDGKKRYKVTASESDTGIIMRINNVIRDINENLNTIVKFEKVKREELTGVKADIGKPFAKQAELDKLNAELIRINTELTQGAGVTNTTEVFADMDDSEINADEVDAYFGYDQSKQASTTIWEKRERVDKDTKNISDLSTLVTSLSTRFGIPVNKGKLRNVRAEGEYNRKKNTIRTKVDNAIPVLAHELGHYFDNKYKFTSNNLDGFDAVVTYYTNELLAMGYDSTELNTESLAEYFRDYISNHEETENLFPKFTKAIKEQVTKVDWRNLNAYAKEVNGYLSATQEERFRATIHKRQTYNKFKEQAELIKMNPQTAVNKALDKFVFDWIDMYMPIKYAELKTVGSTKVYDQIMQSSNLDLKVQQSLLNGIYDLNGAKITPWGIKDYLAAAINLSNGKPERIKADFSLYLNNRQASYLVDNGVRAYADDTLNKQTAIQNNIALLDGKYPVFDDMAKNIYKFNQTVLYEYGVKTGLISEAGYDAMVDKYPNHVPFYRVLTNMFSESKDTKKGIANQHSPVKRIKGSGLDTYDPIENIVYSTSAIMKAGTRNKIMLDLAEIADTTEGFGVYMEKIPPDMVANITSLSTVKERIAKLPETTTSKELKAILDKLDGSEVEFLIDTVIDNVGDTIKTYKSKRSNKNNVVSVKRNGEYEYYEVHHEGVLKSIESLTPSSSGVVLKVMHNLTSGFKTLATGTNPFFAHNNVIRDYTTGLINSDTTKNPIKYMVDWVSALGNVIFESDMYKEYMANGGGYLGSITSDARVFRQTMRNMSDADTNKFKKAIINGKNVIDNVMWIINKGDDIPRFAEYIRTHKKTGDKMQAGRAAQEVTVNFKRGGRIARELNKFIPFFNATLQANYQIIDNFFLKGYNEYLKTGRKRDALAKLAPSYFMYIIGSLISAALVQLWNRLIAPELLGTDPNDFTKASAYMKNNYYLFALPDGKFIRIPKAQGLNVLESAIERALDYFMFDDPNAYYNFLEYMGNAFLLPTGVTLIQTVIEFSKNENFMGTPIVPSYMENYDKKLQYDDNTSQVAYVIGQVFNLSPKQVDHFVTSNLGYLGKVNKNMFPMNSDKMDWSLGFYNQFVADSTYSTDIINRFYDERDNYTVMAKSYELTDGNDDRYTYEDVYNKYKYDKYASLYSKVTGGLHNMSDTDEKRRVRNIMNNTIGDVVNAGMTEIDEFVSYVIQEYGYDIDEIAPYVTVPTSVYYKYQDDKGNHYVKDDGNNKIKTELQYEDMIVYNDYFIKTIMPIYEDIINMSGTNPSTGMPITEQDKAATMIYIKKKTKDELDMIAGAELYNKYNK